MFAFKLFLVFTSFVFYSYGASWSNWVFWNGVRPGYCYDESELKCREGNGIDCIREGRVYRIIIYRRCNEFCDRHNKKRWENTLVRLKKLLT